MGTEVTDEAIRQVVDRAYTFQVKVHALRFVAMRDCVLADARRWNEPEPDKNIL